MNEVDCVACKVQACTEELSKTPAFCPRRNASQAIAKAEEIRKNDPEVRKIVDVAREVETEGYRVWPRVRELIEFSKRMKFRKLGTTQERTASYTGLLY